MVLFVLRAFGFLWFSELFFGFSVLFTKVFCVFSVFRELKLSYHNRHIGYRGIFGHIGYIGFITIT